MPAGVGANISVILSVAANSVTAATQLQYAPPEINYVANELGPVLGSQSVLIVGQG